MNKSFLFLAIVFQSFISLSANAQCDLRIVEGTLPVEFLEVFSEKGYEIKFFVPISRPRNRNSWDALRYIYLHQEVKAGEYGIVIGINNEDYSEYVLYKNINGELTHISSKESNLDLFSLVKLIPECADLE